MYKRFSDLARKTMRLANQAAQDWNHCYIGTEHILAGLIKEGSGIASQVLKNLDVYHKVLLEVEKRIVPWPNLIAQGKLPQTPMAQKVIGHAIEAARELKHDWVGTEHILIGLVREQEGVASEVLKSLGVTLEVVKEEALNLIGAIKKSKEKFSVTSDIRPGNYSIELGIIFNMAEERLLAIELLNKLCNTPVFSREYLEAGAAAKKLLESVAKS